MTNKRTGLYRLSSIRHSCAAIEEKPLSYSITISDSKWCSAQAAFKRQSE